MSTPATGQHIADKGAPMVCDWYSNAMRGVRPRRLPPE